MVCWKPSSAQVGAMPSSSSSDLFGSSLLGLPVRDLLGRPTQLARVGLQIAPSSVLAEASRKAKLARGRTSLLRERLKRVCVSRSLPTRTLRTATHATEVSNAAPTSLSKGVEVVDRSAGHGRPEGRSLSWISFDRHGGPGELSTRSRHDP